MAAYPNVNAAQKYARDVVAGRVIACQFVKQACARHLNDLKASKAKAYPYRFDRDAAERVCKFIQLLVHTKGEWRGRRITLEPWQLFIYATAFGWLRKKDKTRRFREVYIEVPRKNGKSILAAGTGLYMLCADKENGAEVYCGAGSEKQAWMVFKPAKQIAEALPDLRKYFSVSVWAKKLVLPDGSVFEPVIGRPGDGASPHAGIVDEYHEHLDASLYDTLVTGMGARRQPLMWTITTAGFDLAGPCYELRGRVAEMLGGVQVDDRLFGIIYTLDEGDDWTTEAALEKANPNLDISADRDHLLAEQAKGINRAYYTNTFKTKYLNIWVSAKAAFFNMEAWRKCEDKTLTVEQFRGVDCYYGFDLARKLDLTGMVRVFVKVIDGRTHYYCVTPKFWVPEDTVFNSDDRRTSERYKGWVKSGALESTQGAEVDYREVLAMASRAHMEAPANESGVDPHGAANLSQQLDEAGLNPVNIQQTYTHLSDPMKELEAAIITGRFHHDGHPILTWCVSNVVGRHIPGNDDVVKPEKQGNHNKIDGAVALIMAIGRAMNAAQSGGDVLDSLTDDDILVM